MRFTTNSSARDGLDAKLIVGNREGWGKEWSDAGSARGEECPQPGGCGFSWAARKESPEATESQGGVGLALLPGRSDYRNVGSLDYDARRTGHATSMSRTRPSLRHSARTAHPCATPLLPVRPNDRMNIRPESGGVRSPRKPVLRVCHRSNLPTRLAENRDFRSQGQHVFPCVPRFVRTAIRFSTPTRAGVL